MRGASKGSQPSSLHVDLSYLYHPLYSDGYSLFTYSPLRGRRYLDYSEASIRFATDRMNGFKTRVRVRAKRAAGA